MNKVNFGFKQVEENEKQSLVGKVFSSVASKYDLMNDVMSLGIHRMWKNKLIEQLAPDKKLLDVAAGTGDIAKRYYKKCNNPDITLCDINIEMLEQGRNKLLDENIFKGLNFVCANAENLPFEDNSFDYYTIAFGIRNVTNITKALKEAYRVLRPDGKFVCLEFAKVNEPILAKIYDAYSMHIIPKIGEVITGDEASYQYLVESIRTFPKQEIFTQMISDAGFRFCQYQDLSFGVVSLYTGYKA